jgi:cytochrome d ubiquinol oxidase subunit I
LFGLPDMAAETNHYAIEVPDLGSLILTHSLNGTLPGLKDVPPDQRAHVPIVFFAFRIMVGVGILMLGIVALGWLLYRRGRLFENPWYIRACQFTLPLGFIAVLAGWTTTEAGRQPWTVYGLLRTADSVTPSLSGHDVLLSLLLYALAYLVIYPTGVFYMLHLVRKGPGEQTTVSPVQAGRTELPVARLPSI